MHGHPFGHWTYGYGSHQARHEDDGQTDFLGGGAELGVAPAWFSSLVALVPGGTNKLAEFETYLRSEARAGAEAAIPTIQTEVKKTVTPYIAGALVLGLGGFLFGLGALRIARSRG